MTAPLELGAYPTPLHRLDRLSAHLGLRVWAKREDLCGLAVGGNKVRKLRLLLADAVASGATVVLTAGGVQSNHCAQTAVAARILGLPVELFLQGDDPGGRPGNLLLDELAGATLHFTGEADCIAAMGQRAEALAAAGERPYVIPLGGSSPLGAAAASAIVDELVEQLPDPGAVSSVAVAAGSVGTAAGIALGVARHRLDWRVHAVTVLWRRRRFETALDELVGDDARARAAVDLDESQLGDGYGIATVAGAAAAELALRTEGLVLDPTYTAKAFAGLLAAAEAGRGGEVVFVHTGGIGGLFA